MKAVLLISHGSHSSKTEEEVSHFVEVLRQQSDISIIEYAFLEIARPSIPEGIESCVQKGATKVIILLNFLNAGKHVDEDIPLLIEEARSKHSNVTFHITKPLGQHDQIINLFLDVIQKSDNSQ